MMDCVARTKVGGPHNVYTGPDASNSVLTTTPGGIQFLVKRSFGPTEEGIIWYEVQTADGPGWLINDTVQVEGTECGGVAEEIVTPEMTEEEVGDLSESEQALEPPPVVLKECVFNLLTVVSNGLRVRTEPHDDASILVYGLRKGVEAEWLEQTDDLLWHRVRLFDSRQTEGWVSAEYTRVDTITERQVSPNISPNEGEVLVEVPYHSQEDIDAKYAWADCGPASLRMIIGWNAIRFGKPNPDLTVDAVTKTVGIGPKQFSHFRQLIPAARKFGLEMFHTNQATLPRVKHEIDFGRPVLSLVQYGAFSERQHKKFTAGHFLVVTGYNSTHVIVNDPYWSGTRRDEGNGFAIPIDEFEYSIGPRGSRKAGNMPHQALFLDTRSL